MASAKSPWQSRARGDQQRTFRTFVRCLPSCHRKANIGIASLSIDIHFPHCSDCIHLYVGRISSFSPLPSSSLSEPSLFPFSPLFSTAARTSRYFLAIYLRLFDLGIRSQKLKKSLLLPLLHIFSVYQWSSASLFVGSLTVSVCNRARA